MVLPAPAVPVNPSGSSAVSFELLVDPGSSSAGQLTVAVPTSAPGERYPIRLTNSRGDETFHGWRLGSSSTGTTDRNEARGLVAACERVTVDVLALASSPREIQVVITPAPCRGGRAPAGR